MARQPLPIETWGKIRRITTPAGTPAAVAYVRDTDGKRRRVLRAAATHAQAEAALRESLRARLAPTTGYLNTGSTIAELAAAWAKEIEKSSRSTATIRRYKSVISVYVNEHVGGIRIQEATVPRLQRIIELVETDSTPAQARMLGVVLAGMFDLAVRHGAAKSNPARLLKLPPAEQKEVRAPSMGDLRALRHHLAAYDKGKPGRAASIRDLTDFADMMLATGARIGEVLALQWGDFNLEQWTVTIQATIVNDGGLKRKNPKTKSSLRTLTLPEFIRPMLSKRHQDAFVDWIFPSATGGPRWPENVRQQWRDALRGTDVEWIGPHDLRKAVATALGTEGAMAQLGHATSAVTDKHYVEKVTMRPDQTAVLELFGSLRN